MTTTRVHHKKTREFPLGFYRNCLFCEKPFEIRTSPVPPDTNGARELGHIADSDVMLVKVNPQYEFQDPDQRALLMFEHLGRVYDYVPLGLTAIEPRGPKVHKECVEAKLGYVVPRRSWKAFNTYETELSALEFIAHFADSPFSWYANTVEPMKDLLKDKLVYLAITRPNNH